MSKSEITLSVDKGMDGSIDYVINLNTPKTGGVLEKSNKYFYPNPFNPFNQTGVFRYSLSKDGNIKIKIFDAANVLVKEILVGYQHGQIEQSIPWDGKNDNGIMVANGVYLYFVESDSGERAVGKIAVIK